MKWALELVRIRRHLRDPKGNIWGEPLLRGLFNNALYDFQREIGMLEEVLAIPVPPRFNCSYLHDWEYEFLPTKEPAYQALQNQGEHYAYCHDWEVQENFGIAGDTPNPGDAYTHPFEAWYVTPSLPPVWPFPQGFHSVKGLWYDELPMPILRQKDIERGDSAWRKVEGEPCGYVINDIVRNEFSLYPKPSTNVWNDEDVTGMVTSVSGDTTGSETGIITQRTGNLLGSELGISISVIDADDNVLLVYLKNPVELSGPGGEIDLPPYLIKYVRYKTLERAFLVNNNGQDGQASQLWGARYEAGIQAVKRFKSRRDYDRDRQLGMTQPRGWRSRHPRLPDEYPRQTP